MRSATGVLIRISIICQNNNNEAMQLTIPEELPITLPSLVDLPITPSTMDSCEIPPTGSPVSQLFPPG